MADTTLNDIKKQLLENKKSQVAGDKTLIDAVDDVGDSIEKMVKLYTRSLLDKEEERREGQKQVRRASGGGSTSSSTTSRGLFPALGLTGLIQPLTAGIAAFGAAMVGLRGWELKAIANMKTLLEKSIPISIQNGVTKIRNSVFRIFGLTPQGVLSRDALGRFTKTPPITQQIRMRMNALRIRVLSVFGLGPDGKLLALRGDDGLFKKNIIGRVTFQVNRLLKPLVRVAEGIGKFAGGIGKPIFDGIRNLVGAGGGTVAKWLGVFGKILAPLGFLISAYNGIQGFIASDKEGIFAKAGEGIGDFFGSFFGAPLNLIKDGFAWAMTYFFGLKTDPETGEVLPNQGVTGKVVGFLQKLDFNELISSIVQIPFDFLQGAINWVGKFFKDPMGTLEEAWKKVGEGISGVGQYLRDWVTDVWAWIKSFIPDVSTIAANFREKLLNSLPDWARDAIEALGPSDKFSDTDLVNQTVAMANPRRGYERGQDMLQSSPAYLNDPQTKEAAMLQLLETMNAQYAIVADVLAETQNQIAARASNAAVGAAGYSGTTIPSATNNVSPELIDNNDTWRALSGAGQ